MRYVIEPVGLVKRFNEAAALDGLDLGVPEGTVLALLGPNGAGKTTLVKILTTLLLPDEGRASVAGHDIPSEAREVRARIGLSGQEAAVDEYQPVRIKTVGGLLQPTDRPEQSHELVPSSAL